MGLSFRLALGRGALTPHPEPVLFRAISTRHLYHTILVTNVNSGYRDSCLDLFAIAVTVV